MVIPLRDTGIDCALISVKDCSQLGHLGMVHLSESVINRLAPLLLYLFCRGCGSILCVCGSLEIVRQFAGVPFRLSENAEQHLPRHQISIADLADESGVNFDLMSL